MNIDKVRCETICRVSKSTFTMHSVFLNIKRTDQMLKLICQSYGYDLLLPGEVRRRVR